MYSYDTRVTMSCTGPDGHQTPTSLVTMMQDCSMLWMDSEPELAAFLERENAAMMVASRQVDFHRYPAYDERLQVRTWIYKLRPLMGHRNTIVVDESGGIVASCWAIGVFVSYETGKMVALSDEVTATIRTDPKLDMEYLKRKIVLPEVAPVELPGLVAQRSDLDFNGHVNNAQYVRMACDLLPEDSPVKRLRIMHEGQARAGQSIRPMLYEEADADGSIVRRVYDLNDDDGSPFATVELS